jgi:hypothetical protein
MREELDNALCEKYPEVFRDRRAPMTDTLMCWGFSCGDGWYNIIDTLCGLLTSEYRQAKDRYEYTKGYFDKEGKYPWKGGKEITTDELEKLRVEMEQARERIPVAVQVKEKFGGLRFYVDRASDKHYDYITFAESMSYRTCEECGAPGQRYTLGWHRTLCDHHADESYGEEAAHYRNKTGEWAEDDDQ